MKGLRGDRSREKKETTFAQAPLLEEDGVEQQVDEHGGSGHEQGVEAIPKATMAGENASRVLHTGSSLDERLDEIAKGGKDADRKSHANP